MKICLSGKLKESCSIQKDYPEAQVKVTVWCVYDKAQNSVQVIKEDMQKAGQAIEVNGSHTVGYDSANGRLYGSCGGSLVYWDEHKAYQSEDFHKDITSHWNRDIG